MDDIKLLSRLLNHPLPSLQLLANLGKHQLVLAYDMRQQPDKIGGDVRGKKQERDQMGGEWGRGEVGKKTPIYNT